LITRETLLSDTPAWRATSSIVWCPRKGGIAGALERVGSSISPLWSLIQVMPEVIDDNPK